MSSGLVRVRELLWLESDDCADDVPGMAFRVTAILDDSSDPAWIELSGYPIAFDGTRLTERKIRVFTEALRQERTHRAP